MSSIDGNSLHLTSNHHHFTLHLPQETSMTTEAITKEKIDACKTQVISYLSSSLKSKDFKFTGKLSTANIQEIQRIVGRALSIDGQAVSVDVQPLGLSLYQKVQFISAGEPETNTHVYYKVGAVINPNSDPSYQMVYVQQKRFGVEPGFEAIFLKDVMPGGALYDKAISIFNNPSNQVIGTYAEWIETDEARAVIIDKILESPQELDKALYFVKMDYRKEQDQGTSSQNEHTSDLQSKVRIPEHRAKNSIHRATTADTIQAKNQSAVIEVLANDIYRALGFPSQEAFIIPASYPSGEAKMLVASKCVTGTQGEKWTTFEGNIFEGRLIGNRLIGENTDGQFETYELSEDQLVLANHAQRMLGDRDGVGGEGKNIGYYIDKDTKQPIIINIDPGKSLEAAPEYSYENVDDVLPREPKSFIGQLIYSLLTYIKGLSDRLRIKDLNNDCTFTTAKNTFLDFFQGEYTNFSVFEDTTLAENIAGVNALLANREAANEVFNQYIDEPANQDYLQAIQDAKKRFNERLDFFESQLKTRLSLSPNELTVLENIEKLTSRTTNIANREGGVALKHLKVLPKTRKEWSFEKSKAEGEFDKLTFKPKNKLEKKRVIKRLQAFDKHLQVIDNGEQLEIELKPPTTLENLAIKLSEENIAKHKKQILLNYESYTIKNQTFNLTDEAAVQELYMFIKNRKMGPKSKKAARGALRAAINLQNAKLAATIKTNATKIKRFEKEIEALKGTNDEETVLRQLKSELLLLKDNLEATKLQQQEYQKLRKV